jgi:hypothetical protein
MNTDLAELRQRLRKMPDQELLRFGIAAEFMCSAGSNCGHAPRQAFVMQFEKLGHFRWRRCERALFATHYRSM